MHAWRSQSRGKIKNVTNNYRHKSKMTGMNNYKHKSKLNLHLLDHAHYSCHFPYISLCSLDWFIMIGQSFPSTSVESKSIVTLATHAYLPTLPIPMGVCLFVIRVSVSVRDGRLPGSSIQTWRWAYANNPAWRLLPSARTLPPLPSICCWRWMKRLPRRRKTLPNFSQHGARLSSKCCPASFYCHSCAFWRVSNSHSVTMCDVSCKFSVWVALVCCFFYENRTNTRSFYSHFL